MKLLTTKTSSELSAQDIRAELESHLWMLQPGAFLYFLPALLSATAESYDSLSLFAAEVVTALTRPSRTDVAKSLERAAQIPPGLGLPERTMDWLRERQFESFDSGGPGDIFRRRFDELSVEEGAAVLAFLVQLKESHGEDFPFGELDDAMERHWKQFA